jgi:hypothetical protein
VHPAPILHFRDRRETESRSAGIQDAVEDYSKSGAQIQVFHVWRSAMGRAAKRRNGSVGGGIAAAE